MNVTLCSKAYKLNQHIIESSTLRKFGIITRNLICALHDMKDIQKKYSEGMLHHMQQEEEILMGDRFRRTQTWNSL